MEWADSTLISRELTTGNAKPNTPANKPHQQTAKSQPHNHAQNARCSRWKLLSQITKSDKKANPD